MFPVFNTREQSFLWFSARAAYRKIHNFDTFFISYFHSYIQIYNMKAGAKLSVNKYNIDI